MCGQRIDAVGRFVNHRTARSGRLARRLGDPAGLTRRSIDIEDVQLDRLDGLLDALRRITAFRGNVRHDECRLMHLGRGVLIAADDADDRAQAVLEGIEQGIERAHGLADLAVAGHGNALREIDPPA